MRLLQKGFQYAAVDGADKSGAHLFVLKGAVGLIKNQSPDNIFGFFAAHTVCFCLAVLFIISKAAVRFAVHQQLEAGGSGFALFLLNGGLNIPIHVQVDAGGLHHVRSIIVAVFFR